MLTGNPGHLASFDYLGLHRYSLTFCTKRRAKHFISHDRVDLVSTQFERAETECAFATIAYCFMPDHVHLLVDGLTDASDCLSFIDRAKQYSGYYFKKAFRVFLWQRYGFEHTLRKEEDTLGVARYILENPVRAGLVARVEDYPFCGSKVYQLADILQAVQMTPAYAKTR